MSTGLIKKALRALLNKNSIDTYSFQIDSDSRITLEHQDNTYDIPSEMWNEVFQEVQAVPSSGIKAQSPEMEWYRIPFPKDLPNKQMELESKLYSVFQGPNPVPASMAHLDATERRELLASLSNELFRVRYHYGRFLQILETARRRKRAMNASIATDLILRYSYYEASSMMTSARSVVEQLVHMCLRINWNLFHSNRERDKFRASAVFEPSTKDISISIFELTIFRNHKTWYGKLNTYRNVMIHQGWKVVQSPGYYDSNDPIPESKNYERNPMFLPDDSSIVGNKRPHEWTYDNGNRLDHFLNSLQIDIESITDELVTHWGVCSQTPAQVPYDEFPNILVVRHFAIPILDGEVAFVPLFTDESKVIPFYQNQNPQLVDKVLPCALSASREADGLIHPGYHFQLPNPYDIIADIRQHGHSPPKYLLIMVDPLLDTPTAQQKILVQLPFIQEEHDHKDGKIGKGITLSLEAFGNIDRIFIGRKKPT